MLISEINITAKLQKCQKTLSPERCTGEVWFLDHDGFLVVTPTTWSVSIVGVSGVSVGMTDE